MGPLWMLLCSDKDIKRYQIVISCVSLFNFFGAWAFLLLGYNICSVIIVRIFVYFTMLIVRLTMSKKLVPSFQLKEWLLKIGLVPILLTFIALTSYFLINDICVSNHILEIIIKAGLLFVFTCVIVFIGGLESNERKFVLSKVHLM